MVDKGYVVVVSTLRYWCFVFPLLFVKRTLFELLLCLTVFIVITVIPNIIHMSMITLLMCEVLLLFEDNIIKVLAVARLVAD